MIMINAFFRVCIFFSFSALGSSCVFAYDVDLQKSGVMDFYPSCKLEKKSSLCIERINIDEEKRVFITVNSNFDSTPELLEHDLKDTSSKIRLATFVLRILIGKFNPRFSEEFSGEKIRIKLDNASLDNITVLMKANINKSTYSGFSYIDDDGVLLISVKETDIEPDDYFYSELRNKNN
ncbi:hypothetical protein [Vibrio sp. Isolate24]|uniref:hypothetical protein n=1 Tax=Vibrio sp. Isolate24 TaxID=2908534 RepID=UPI001EFDCE80|nr:hypothetical protein [Vibrio sp. Isolate24]MCG9679195.1 hypothetical protein [Vibrio sp. Isolate24]